MGRGANIPKNEAELKLVKKLAIAGRSIAFIMKKTGLTKGAVVHRLRMLEIRIRDYR